MQLGASFSVGIDIDPKAVTSAQRNAALNNIGSEKMQVYLVPTTISCITDQSQCGDEEQSVAVIAKKYDIVIANILLNPLLDLADQIVDYAKPGGIVGISGILYEQLPKIEERYSQYLEGVSVSEMDGWVCLSGKKKADSRSN
ncbi:hypothetical protein IFM89_031767 [Coptis chinensis]|uniref:ETFB lysine methyltransferase n=1 Tax=Coptis chinensis TaxID=261450 RepID=A0A835H245_9MAGN|nr:hypothetical protein IFM89_031767 [Coptis chinensis]